MSKKAQWAWAGGFFEGEGNIDISNRGDVRLQIFQKRLRPLELWAEVTGAGRIYRRVDGWDLAVYRKEDIRRILTELLGTLQNKYAEALLLLDALDHKPSRRISFFRPRLRKCREMP